MAERLSGEVADKFGGAINAASLARYVERVAEVMEQQKALAEDIAAICGEADEAGVASKRELRRLARESLMEPDVLSEQLARMADLRAALGSYAATPLGAAALAVRPAPPPGPPRRHAVMRRSRRRRSPSSRWASRAGGRARPPGTRSPTRGCTWARRRATRERPRAEPQRDPRPTPRPVVRMTPDACEICAILEAIKPLLAGRAAAVQGTVLADLLATWLAGHLVEGDEAASRQLRSDLLASHVDAVWMLTEVNAEVNAAIIHGEPEGNA